MVGAIADWFAVTALFRHPLGLPIPHTALIPRRKDELGKGLAGVRRRELPPGGRSSASGSAPPQVTQRVGRRGSASPRTPAGWSTRSPTSPRSGWRKVEDEHVAELVEEVLVPRFREEPIAPLLGRFARRGGPRRPPPRRRRPGARGAAPLAGEQPGDLHRGAQRAGAVVGAARGSTRPVTTRLHLEAVRWLADIRDDPHHHARRRSTRLLAQLGQDLLHDAATQERAEAAQAPGARAPAVPGHRDLAVEGACATRCSKRPAGRRTARCASALAARAGRRFGRAGPRRRAAARQARRAASPTSRSSRSSGTAPS